MPQFVSLFLYIYSYIYIIWEHNAIIEAKNVYVMEWIELNEKQKEETKLWMKKKRRALRVRQRICMA